MKGQEPGTLDSDTAVSEPLPLFSAPEMGDFRSQWSKLQTGFVDEPRDRRRRRHAGSCGDPAVMAAPSRPENYVLEVVMTVGKITGTGNPGNLSLYGPRPRVKEVAVSGSFMASAKKRTINQLLVVE